MEQQPPPYPSQPPYQIIQVVRFTYCTSPKCAWPVDPNPDSPLDIGGRQHVAVSRYALDLHQEKSRAASRAVAVSYTWGSFARTARRIGHYDDVSEGGGGGDVIFTLGEEWETDAFAGALVRSCEGGDGCWIDQLCVPQQQHGRRADDHPGRGGEVREALAAIPDIYRGLDVHVLMPGAPCRCLFADLETVSVAREFGSDAEVLSCLGRVRGRLVGGCWGMVPLSGWFGRVWTRQELLYSRRVRVVWTGSVAAGVGGQCVDLAKGGGLHAQNWVTGVVAQGLPPFNRAVYRSTAAKSYSQLFGEGRASVGGAVREAVRTGRPAALLGVIPALTEKLTERVLAGQVYGDSEAGRRVREKALEGQRLLERSRQEWAVASEKTATGTVAGVLGGYLKAASDALGEYTGPVGGGWGGSNAEDGEADVFHTLLRFLAGETLENGAPDPGSLDAQTRLRRFLSSLGGLRDSTRAATQDHDYVNSIWVDCPLHAIPPAHKSLPLPALLQNALDQLRSNHGATVLTTAPGGLLGATTQTGVWQPALTLPAEVKDASHIYSPLTHPFPPLPITPSGHIPLRLLHPTAPALSALALDYGSTLSTSPTGSILRTLHPVLRAWALDLFSHNRPTRTDELLASYDNDGQGMAIVGRTIAGSVGGLLSGIVSGGVADSQRARAQRAQSDVAALRQRRADEADFRRLLIEGALAARRGEAEAGAPRRDAWAGRAEVPHARIVYEMVAEALGLDVGVCRARGLRVMLTKSPPCIGFANRDVGVARSRGGGVLRTVCMSVVGPTGGGTLYEVEKVGEGRWRVFGVWVPMVPVPDEHIYAYAEAGAVDGFIV